jgi:hypothetical protein
LGAQASETAALRGKFYEFMALLFKLLDLTRGRAATYCPGRFQSLGPMSPHAIPPAGDHAYGRIPV